MTSPSAGSDRPLDLLLVAPLFPPLHSGAGRQAESILQRLHPEVRTRVLTLAAPDLPRIETLGAFAIHRIGQTASPRAARSFGIAVARHLVSCAPPDVLLTLGVGPATYAAIAIGTARGIPVAVKLTLEGQDDPATLRAKFGGATRLRCLRAAQSVICPSDRLHRIALDAGLDPKRVRKIPNGVDSARFAPRNGREQAQVAFLGAVDERKGLHLVLEAVAQLAPTHPSLRLLVIGAWDLPVPSKGHAAYVTGLRARIAAPDLADRVTILGETDRPEDALAACSILVLPSQAEGLPNALLEAMAAGVVPVVSDLPAMREVVSPESGVLVPESTPRAWTNALDSVLRDPARRAQMSAAARQTVMDHFDLTAVAQSYLALLRETARSLSE